MIVHNGVIALVPDSCSKRPETVFRRTPIKTRPASHSMSLGQVPLVTHEVRFGFSRQKRENIGYIYTNLIPKPLRLFGLRHSGDTPREEEYRR
jgi:hypothetical protein